MYQAVKPILEEICFFLEDRVGTRWEDAKTPVSAY
jgi:hypothetical protein